MRGILRLEILALNGGEKNQNAKRKIENNRKERERRERC